MCLEKDDKISMTMEGGDLMGHCDDVRMDAENRGWFCVTVVNIRNLNRKDEKS